MWKLGSKNQVEIVLRQRVILGVFTTPIFLTEPLFFRRKRCITGLIDIILFWSIKIVMARAD